MVNFCRFLLSKWYVAMCLSASMLFYSCHSVESEPTHSFSGEELFTGIFFGQGEVLDYIPQLKERQELNKFLKTDEEMVYYKEMQMNIISMLKAKDPQFFKEFKINIESGNHVKITAAIRNATEGVINAVNHQYGLKAEQLASISKELDDKTDIKRIILQEGSVDEKSYEPELNSILVGYLDTNVSDTPSGDRGTCVVGPIAIAIAAVLVAVITIAAVFVDVYPSESSSRSSSLLSEQVIQSIATNLAAE